MIRVVVLADETPFTPLLIERRRGETQLFAKEVTLDTLTLTNVEIVRSFSFVGEVDRPEDPETHQLEVDIRSPVTVTTAEES